MASISNKPSDQFYKSPLFVGAGIASVGLITAFFLRRSYVYQKKTCLMKTLSEEPGFRSFSNIQATPTELSQIAGAALKPTLIRVSNISKRNPFEEPTLPSSITKTVNRLAGEILSLTNASSVKMFLKAGEDNPFGWHMDYSYTNTVPSIRFFCTLRGPTTRFAQLSLEKRREFKHLQDQYIQAEQQYDRKKQTTYMEQAVEIDPLNTFSTKVGEVIAFSNESPLGIVDKLSYGAVHATPLSLDPNRVLVIFDVSVK